MTATATPAPARPTADRTSRADADRAAGLRLPLALSETALLVVHLAVVAGFARLFEDGAFVGPLVGFVVGAHVLAVVVRRRRVPAPLALLVALVGAALASTWILFPATARLGLPTAETWDVARDALRVSRDRFEEVAAPAPALPGFLLASGLALWLAVWFADWAAFRLRATAEAVAPAAVLFVFGAMLGSGDHRLVSAIGFAAAVLVFVASHRALRSQLDHAWLTTSPIAGPRAVLKAGVALAVVGIVAGAVVGPRLPGSESDAVVRWRSDVRGGGDRTTVSPIIDLRPRLVNQSDTRLFTVEADRPAYWRLTSLDTFDGEIWRSGGTYSAVDGALDRSGPRIEEVRRNQQTIRIEALQALWVPTAYQARGITDATESLSWDRDSSTLIVEDAATSDGLRYTVVSEAPVFDPDVLRAAGENDLAVIEDRYETLPTDFPDQAREAVRQVTEGVGGRYEQAIALQNWFRTTFDYSLDVDAGHGDDALVAFLDRRTGYCEQFAGAYAAMARSIGIPARVAVGFTPGDADPDDPSRYVVRGRHAHAWPELWFPGVGWVPFEPTPGRGLPDAEDYTGVPPEQDESLPPIAPPTTATTVPVGPSTVPPATTPEETIPRNAPLATGGASDDDGRSGLATAALVAAALVLAWLAVVLLVPVVRRRRRGTAGPASSVLASWHDAQAPARWLTGLRARPAETHHEFADRAAPALGPAGASLTELATLATGAAWDPAGSDPATAARADELAGELAAEARRRQRPLMRLRQRLSWREAFDRSSPA